MTSIDEIHFTEHDSWATLVFEGEDAPNFLQGQVTQDVTSLAVGPRSTFVLDPDGSVLTKGQLSPDGSVMRVTVLADVVERLESRLRRFLLRSRCTISIHHTTPIFGSVASRIASCWPGANECDRGLVVHSFSPRAVEESVSFSKGCYTGQETVARLDARGANPPYRLVVLSGTDPYELDAIARVRGPSGTSGLTTATHDGGGVLALAIVHRSALETEELRRVMVSDH